MKKILLLFLLMASLCSTATEKKHIKKSFQINPQKLIEFMGESGLKVKFRSWAKDSAMVELNVKIKSSEKEFEREYIESFDVVFRENDFHYTIGIEAIDYNPSISIWDILTLDFKRSVSIDISGYIYIPDKNSLSARIRYSEINLEGMSGKLNIIGRGNTIRLSDCTEVREIENDYGEVYIKDCRSPGLKLSTRSSKVRIDSFTGRLDINAPYTEIYAERCDGDVDIRSGSSRIEAETVSGSLHIDAQYADIKLHQIRDSVIILTRSAIADISNISGLRFKGPYSKLFVCDISGERFNETVIENRSGSIELHRINSNLRIDDEYSQINLDSVNGNVLLKSRSNEIKCRYLKGNWESDTRYSNIILEDAKSRKLMIKNISGSVETEMVSEPEYVDISNKHGDVNLMLNKSFSGKFNLEVEYGKINSDFPLTLNYYNSNGKKSIASEVGNSNNIIKIKNRSGSINLLKHSD
ncbi:MAG: DUF4097 family beta strand repeat protein [Melioribacteraceae bacterium]|nr:DUF4097 family beta strand repeat protein [Melioribacteraceae bacterium]